MSRVEPLVVVFPGVARANHAPLPWPGRPAWWGNLLWCQAAKEKAGMNSRTVPRLALCSSPVLSCRTRGEPILHRSTPPTQLKLIFSWSPFILQTLPGAAGGWLICWWFENSHIGSMAGRGGEGKKGRGREKGREREGTGCSRREKDRERKKGKRCFD